MSVVQSINASLQLWGCVMTAVVAICLVLSKRPVDRCERMYFWILGCNAGALFFDAAALFFRGRPGPVGWWGVRAANFIAFYMNYALLESFAHYLTEFLARRTDAPRWPLRVSRIVCLCAVVLLVLTQFFPLIYTIDAQNVYHRAPYFWLSHASGLVVMLLCAWLLVRCRRTVEPQEQAALWAYIVLPLFALIMQMFVYGLALLNLVNTVAIVVIFLFIQAEQGRRAAVQENELTQSRVAIMLSQIQPHFLYNALSVIQNLCHGKAPEAEQATVQFAEFLRGNLDSLQADAPIPFSRELSHTQNYLWLEKQRFLDALRVEYDIQAVDFSIPALTLQPVAENAVRYGVTQKEDGGTVRISSRETPDAFVVTVEDDGAGFDPYTPKADGRTHIGIANVRDRLRVMCGGSLAISSTPGAGTVAVITVPKAET